jgi:hypothetical protein
VRKDASCNVINAATATIVEATVIRPRSQSGEPPAATISIPLERCLDLLTLLVRRARQDPRSDPSQQVAQMNTITPI